MVRTIRRLTGAWIAAAILVAGCARLPTLPPPARLAAGAAPALPPRPPLLRPGERLEWRLQVGPFAGGEVTITAATGWMDGRRVAVVRGRFATAGVAALFDDRSSDDVTWLDLRTARPVRYRSDLAGDGESSRVDVRFEPGGIRLVERQGHEERRAHQLVPSGDEPLNMYAALFALRAWPDEARTATLSIWARSRLWRATVWRRRIELVDTDRGPIRARRFDGIAWRTRRDGRADPDTPARRFRIYLGADRDRLPLRLETDTRFGLVQAILVGARSGRLGAR